MNIQQIQVKNILNKAKLPNAMYSANPYVGCEHNCLYCYASYMLHFNPHTEAWGHFVDIKYWPELTLKQKESLAGQTVCIGTVTDPYQPLEATALRTRTLLEQLQGLGCSLFIITKSDLIMRDIDLLRTFPKVEIAWSICSLDERFRYDIEPSTIPFMRRLAAMEFFHNQGFITNCFIAPVFPVFTDVFGIINTVSNKCDEVLMDPLNLRCQNRPIILNYVRQVFPQLWPLFNQIYNQDDQRYWFDLSHQIELFARQQGFPLNGQGYEQIQAHRPNLVCHFGKFQHLDNFYRRPEETRTTSKNSTKDNSARSAKKDTTNKEQGHQALLFDLDQPPD